MNRAFLHRVLLLVALTLATLALSPATQGQIFVSNSRIDPFRGSTIGEYSTLGTPLNPALVSGLLTPENIAVSGNKLFVVDASANTVGEYTTSGATVNRALISGLNTPLGIAVSGEFLYVVSALGGPQQKGRGFESGSVGKYTTSGATVNAALIYGLNDPTAIAVSGGNLFVTYTRQFFAKGSIGEYTASGATVKSALVSGLNYPLGIAVSGGDLFVTNYYGGTVGEYTTSGATVNPSLISGLSYPTAIAVSGDNLFVGSADPNTLTGKIGEYTTSGVTVNASLISGLNSADGIAVVSSVPDASSSWALLLVGVTATFGLRIVLRQRA